MEPPGTRIPLPNHFPSASESGSDDEGKQEEELETVAEGEVQDDAKVELHADDGDDTMANEAKDSTRGFRRSSEEWRGNQQARASQHNTNPGAVATVGPTARAKGQEKGLRRGLQGRQANQDINPGAVAAVGPTSRAKGQEKGLRRGLQGKQANQDINPGAVAAGGPTVPAKGHGRGLRRGLQERQAKQDVNPGAVAAVGPTAPAKGQEKGLRRGLQQARDERNQLSNQNSSSANPKLTRGLHRTPEELQAKRASLQNSALDNRNPQENPPTNPSRDNSSLVRDNMIAGRSSNPSTDVSFAGENAMDGVAPSNDDTAMQNFRNTNANANLDHQLVQAQPISEETLIQAQEFDPEAADMRHKVFQEKRRRTNLVIGGVVLLIIGGVVAAVLGVTLSNKGSETTEIPTSTPTVPVTSTPTSMPSSAPTMLVDTFRETLPNYTQASLLDPRSPQSRALEWLGDHPEFADMEQWRRKQIYALACFYYSFQGPKWPNGIDKDWVDYNKHECEWFSSGYGSWNVGFLGTVEDENDFQGDGSYRERNSSRIPCETGSSQFDTLNLDEVFVLFEEDPGLRVPPEISLLNELRFFSMPKNRLNATVQDLIPQQMVQLSSLFWIDLSRNFFIHGTIPHYLFQIETNWLTLAFNRISGSLPTEMGSNHKYLHRSINLNDNLIEGPIPSQIGLMQNVLALSLQNNNMSKTIPTEIGLLNLGWLELQNNTFTGPIPSELGLLTKLVRLRLERNMFTSTLPTEIFNLTELEYLSVDATLLPTVPTELFQLTKLKDFIVHEPINSNSTLYNTFPMDIFNRAEFVRELDLSGQGLVGPIPTEIGLLVNLQALLLKNNSFTSTLPSEIGLMTNLRTFDASINRFTGSIPTELALAVSGPFIDYEDPSIWQMEVHLNDNRFSGQIPSELGTTEIMMCHLFNNLLTGNLPSEFGGFQWLFSLDMEFNLLTGMVPTELTRLTTLGTYAANNMFSGQLPIIHTIGLTFGKNLLTGTIDPGFGLVSDLALFSLRENNIGGTIPTELGLIDGSEQLMFSRILLGYNNLTGTIPVELEAQAEKGLLVELNLTGNPGLTGTIPEKLCVLQEDTCFWSFFDPTRPCYFDFKCSAQLCGCNCSCAGPVPSNVAQNFQSAGNLLTSNISDAISSVQFP